ncbi:MAG: hypothetical protein AAGG81_07420, partial [Chlamydiota bacterium]
LKKFVLTATVMCSTIAVIAEEPKSLYKDYGFEQERMVIDRGEIFIVSSFDIEDRLTVYDFLGNRLWETPFHAKITSWQVLGDIIIVFSKSRAGHKTYLTCLDRVTGRLVWQRP